MAIKKNINFDFKIPNKISDSTLSLISKKAGQNVLKHFLRNFTKEGSENESGAFVNWAERQNKKNDKPLLYDTGRMKSGFHLQSTLKGFIISNETPYAQFHQFGTENIPAREMLYDSPEVNKIILDVINKEMFKFLGLK
jgi:phage gpG-like protein